MPSLHVHVHHEFDPEEHPRAAPWPRGGEFVRRGTGTAPLYEKPPSRGTVAKIPVPAPPASRGPTAAQSPRLPEYARGISANSLLEEKSDSSITPESFIQSLSPVRRRALAEVKSRLAQSVPTSARVSQGGFVRDDGSWTPERQKIHAEIIKKILSPEAVKKATPKPGEKPVFTFLGGRGGSGKSWFTSDKGPVKADNALVLDSDAIKAMLPEYKGWNAALLHEETSDIFTHIDGMARRLGLNVVHDSTLRTFHSIADNIERYKNAGYRVNGYYMFVPPEIAAERAVRRFEGRDGKFNGRFVPPEYVLSSRTNEKSFDKVKREADHWELYDNSGNSPKYIDGTKEDD